MLFFQTDDMITLYDDHKSNKHFVNNASHEVSRHFRNKKKEYLKAKINELETNSKKCKWASMSLRTVTSIELTY